MKLKVSCLVGDFAKDAGLSNLVNTGKAPITQKRTVASAKVKQASSITRNDLWCFIVRTSLVHMPSGRSD